MTNLHDDNAITKGSETDRQKASEPDGGADVPEGYALVPIEPTGEMIGIAHHEWDNGATQKEIWRAMIKAAPTPTQPAAPAAQTPQKKTEHLGGVHWGWEGEFNLGWNAAIDAMNSAAPSTAAQRATIDEQRVLAAIKRACGEYRTNDSYSFEDVWNCIEAFSATPTPVADIVGASDGVLHALRAAKQFIANGVELGYIRMPDSDCPDPAHEVPKLIDSAIEQLLAAAKPVSVDERKAVIEEIAKWLDKKADDYATEFGSDDMGSLSFGQGAHAEAKRDYHWSLIELAEELRARKTPPTESTGEPHA